jgi:hypothetical protein
MEKSQRQNSLADCYRLEVFKLLLLHGRQRLGLDGFLAV